MFLLGGSSEFIRLSILGPISKGYLTSRPLLLIVLHLVQMYFNKGFFSSGSDAEGRSFSNFRSWEITNEIEDTFPVVSSLKSAWNKFDDLNKGRSFVEKFDEIWYEIKNFFLQYGIVRRVDSLYRSEAVNPASVYGGVGAGLLGALGLGLLFGGAREGKKARTTGRSLNLDDDNSKEAEVVSTLSTLFTLCIFSSFSFG